MTNRTPMSDRADADDQRTDPRITATHRVHLVVSLHGFDHDDERYEATGITVNISRRGALVRVGQPVATPAPAAWCTCRTATGGSARP